MRDLRFGPRGVEYAVCPTCRSTTVNGACAVCWFREHEKRETSDRLRGACVAMSRFLVWVWLEALAQGWAAEDGCDIDQARAEIGLNEMLGALVQSGRFRLTWGDDPT